MSSINMYYTNDKLIIELGKDDLIKLYEDHNFYGDFVKEMNNEIMREYLHFWHIDSGFETCKGEMSAIIMDYDHDKLIIELGKDDLLKLNEDPNFYVGFVKEMNDAIIREYMYLRCKFSGVTPWEILKSGYKQDKDV